MGKYEITLDHETHIYRVNGKYVPANTAILDDQGISDMTGVPPERLKYKSALGTAVHYCIHLHEKGDLDEESIDPRIAPYFSGYKRFCEVQRFEPEHSELMLYSKKWGYCTTLDLVGPFIWNGRDFGKSILEIKCVFQMQPSNGIQTAAQQLAFEENYDTKIQARFGLQLKPTGSFEVIQYKDPNDKQVFLAALTVYKWRDQNGLTERHEHDRS